jgi:hypothetical protein
MQLCGESDTLSFVRISLLNWIGYVSRKDSKRKVSQVFNSNPKVSRLRRRPKTDCGIWCKQILINVKLQIEKRGQTQSRLGEVL